MKNLIIIVQALIIGALVVALGHIAKSDTIKTLELRDLRIESDARNAEITVRINDTIPARHGRILDLSEAAGRALGMLKKGVVKVRMSPVLMGASSLAGDGNGK